MRFLTAKFSGTCNYCKTEVEVGERIAWERDKGTWHIGCYHDERDAQEGRASEEFNERWAEYKNEHGWREAAQERAAFLAAEGLFEDSILASEEAAG